MDEDDHKKQLIPLYDKKDGCKKTDADKKTGADKKTDAEEPQEQDLQLIATEDDVKVKRSKKERKFELLCVVAIAKTYFSLKLGKDIKANRSEKILCESDPYTRAWASELTSMIDDDANHAKYRTLMPEENKFQW